MTSPAPTTRLHVLHVQPVYFDALAKQTKTREGRLSKGHLAAGQIQAGHLMLFYTQQETAEAADPAIQTLPSSRTSASGHVCVSIVLAPSGSSLSALLSCLGEHAVDGVQVEDMLACPVMYIAQQVTQAQNADQAASESSNQLT